LGVSLQELSPELARGLGVDMSKGAVIAEVVGDLPRTPLAKVLGVGLAKNTGVRRGVVRDLEETTRSIAAATRDMTDGRRPRERRDSRIAGEHGRSYDERGGGVSSDEIASLMLPGPSVARAVSLGKI
jgi:cell division protein FtsA